MSLQVVDPLAWVRGRPTQFFPSGKPDPIYLLAYLLADVLELGGGSCSACQKDGWWIMGSDIDWLADPLIPTEELFRRVVSTPQRGEHTMRGEIVVAGFARSVSTVLRGVQTAILGNPPPKSVMHAANAHTRSIVFEM